MTRAGVVTGWNTPRRGSTDGTIAAETGMGQWVLHAWATLVGWLELGRAWAGRPLRGNG